MLPIVYRCAVIFSKKHTLWGKNFLKKAFLTTSMFDHNTCRANEDVTVPVGDDEVLHVTDHVITSAACVWNSAHLHKHPLYISA